VKFVVNIFKSPTEMQFIVSQFVSVHQNCASTESSPDGYGSNTVYICLSK
jgi:hypothetical protein